MDFLFLFIISLSTIPQYPRNTNQRNVAGLLGLLEGCDTGSKAATVLVLKCHSKQVPLKDRQAFVSTVLSIHKSVR